MPEGYGAGYHPTMEEQITRRLDRIIKLLEELVERDAETVRLQITDNMTYGGGDWLMCPDCGRLLPPGASCDCE